MRKATAFTLASLLTLTACTGETAYGECIGVVEDGRADTTYQLSGWNLAVSIILIGTVIVPVLWATDYAKCPTSRKIIPKAKPSELPADRP